MKEEARDVLRAALSREPPTPTNVATAIRACFADSGGVELEPLPREPIGDPPTFD